MIDSNWDYTVSRSNYHFTNKKDQEGDYFFVHGNVTANWGQELDLLKELARPMNWANRKNTCGRQGETPKYLKAEENDLTRAGADPKMTLVNVVDDFSNLSVLKSVADDFGLEKAKYRIHIQRTGDVFNRHIDTLDQIYPNNNIEDIIRIGIMLTNWEPGHFYCYGNCVYERWTAGEVHTFDWYNVPHCTANATYEPRITLQLTGIKTKQTEAKLLDLN